MKTFLSFITILISFLNLANSQSNNRALLDTKDKIHKVERYILNKQQDSAQLYLSTLKPNVYVKILKRLANNEKLSFKEYSIFIDKLKQNSDIPFQYISEFINQNIEYPNGDINLDYVKLVVNQISDLRDNVSIEEASKVQSQLDEYINFFIDNKDEDVIRARAYASTHQIVLYNIQNETEKGKSLINKNLKISKNTKDSELELLSLYYLCDFLILENKLDEYIKTCELSLNIENTLNKKSNYYVGTLVHIIDAYIYKGGHDKRVQELLDLLYNHEKGKDQSYSLYAKYLGVINKDSRIFDNILLKFKVKNLVDFAAITTKIGEKRLNLNDFYQLQRELSNTLLIHGFYEEAVDYKDKSIVIVKKIYSEDLANALANYKTEQAIKEKDILIEYQKERAQLTKIIGLLIGVMFVVALFMLLNQRKQSKLLESKNLQINQALKDKELLIKEVHHRVKNNFQIVSSLLELQAKDIEDKNAKTVVKEGQNKIKSMAIIHQKLYQNEDGLIDFEEYITLLVNEISALYNKKNNVEVKINTSALKFDLDTAIPLGLIINELVTNACKYAFNNIKNGKLIINLRPFNQDKYVLEVKDNGKGFHQDFEKTKIKSLGLRLVKRLVKQLHGKMKVNNHEGAHFEIFFKNAKARKNID